MDKLKIISEDKEKLRILNEEKVQYFSSISQERDNLRAQLDYLDKQTAQEKEEVKKVYEKQLQSLRETVDGLKGKIENLEEEKNTFERIRLSLNEIN